MWYRFCRKKALQVKVFVSNDIKSYSRLVTLMPMDEKSEVTFEKDPLMELPTHL